MNFRYLGAALFAIGSLCCGSEDPMMRVSFAAMVGAQPVACGQSYAGLGAAGADLEVRDFRFYVHDVRLVTADGTEVALQLVNDGMWQDGRVALLDFEDGCGEMGNALTRTVVEGRAPVGDYTGLRFRLGLPEDLNHQNPSEAAPPLSLSEMFWTWNAGYKFVRIEGQSSAFAGWRVHLGSTRCEGDMMGNATCMERNVPEVALNGFDPTTGKVVADLAALVEGSMLDNTAETAPGCMSSPDDPDCAPIFANLGLSFGGVTPDGQRFFRAEP